jgi:mono/diheme cytochrome c family protein
LSNANLKETPMFASSHISLLKFTAVGGLVVFIGLRAPVAAGELAQNSEAGEPHMPVLTSVGAVTPLQRALSTPKGHLKSPYEDPSTVTDEGYEIYLSLDCNGCHGGGGGGGMAVPLTNPVWVYGDDDDTLFRVIALGTGSLSPDDAFRKQGYTRKGSEAVVGPMPTFGETIKTDTDLWKIIAWIRSINRKDNGAR